MRRHHRHENTKYDIEEMLAMRRRGVTLREIGEQFGVSRQCIHQLLGNTGDITPRIRDYSPGLLRRREFRIRHIPEQKFWESVKIGNKDECWEWISLKYPTGYGRFKRNNYSHRIAYEAIHGPIPEGKVVCHSCNNPGCCNPFHLYAGTMADNMADREARYASGELIRYTRWNKKPRNYIQPALPRTHPTRRRDFADALEAE